MRDSHYRSSPRAIARWQPHPGIDQRRQRSSATATTGSAPASVRHRPSPTEEVRLEPGQQPTPRQAASMQGTLGNSAVREMITSRERPGSNLVGTPEEPRIRAVDPSVEESPSGHAPDPMDYAEEESHEPGWTLGHRPQPGERGSHCYIGGTGHGGVEYSCSAYSEEAPGGTSVDLLRAQGRIGGFEGESGGTQYGATGEVSLFSAEAAGNRRRAEYDVGHVGLGLQVGEEGFEGGADATIASAAYSREVTGASGQRAEIRSGLSAGSSVRLAGHRDPVTGEFGAGVDLGPVTGDHTPTHAEPERVPAGSYRPPESARTLGEARAERVAAGMRGAGEQVEASRVASEASNEEFLDALYAEEDEARRTGTATGAEETERMIAQDEARRQESQPGAQPRIRAVDAPADRPRRRPGP